MFVPIGPGPGENVGGTIAILIPRPHDEGVPVTGDGNGRPEPVTPLFIRRLDFLLFVPIGPGPGENVGRTGAEQGIGAYNHIRKPRPHDGGVPILRDGDGSAEIVILPFIRRLDFLLFVPIGPGPPENVGGTGVSRTRILILRPHDGGVPVTGDGDGPTKLVFKTLIRRLDFLLLAPTGPGPGENVGGTGERPTRILSKRPHDGGVPILRDGDGITEQVIPLSIRRLDFLLFVPIGPGPGENVGGTSATLILRPHDEGVPVTGDGNGRPEPVIRLFIRRQDLGFIE